MPTYGVIYKLTSRTSGKIYIGQTSKSLEERFDAHVAYAKYCRRHHLGSAINRYGRDDFTVEVVAEAANRDELNELERKYIKDLRAPDPDIGYNMTRGGEGGALADRDRIRARMAAMSAANKARQLCAIESAGGLSAVYSKYSSGGTLSAIAKSIGAMG